MTKKLTIILLSLLFMCTASSCESGYKTVNARESNTPGIISMSYTSFDGTKIGDFLHVFEGEPLELEANIITEKGKLSILIYETGNKENIVYEARDIPTSRFMIELTEPGDYELWLEAEDHSGSYDLIMVP